MLIKEATESIKIKQLRIMLQRSSPSFLFRKEMESELARSFAGYQGEKSMDFHLDLLPNDETFIFHDLRIPYRSNHFQLDILILTTKFFLIIEVKNMSGTLIFDQEFCQLIRIFKDKEETFPDPISQLYRQTFLLKEWIKQHRFSTIPIESLVIISNPQTCIKMNPQHSEARKMVTHSSNLLAKFHGFQNKYREEKISKKEIKKLYRNLLKQHSSKTPDLFKQFSLTDLDIHKGVACPNCMELAMVWQKGQWFCVRCGHESRDSHLQALKEYATLYKSSISIRECCDFLRIPSRHVVRHLLYKSNFPTSSEGIHHIFHLNELD